MPVTASLSLLGRRAHSGDRRVRDRYARATVLGRNGTRFRRSSTCSRRSSRCGVSNAEIAVDGPEIPVRDGSAADSPTRSKRPAWSSSTRRARVLRRAGDGVSGRRPRGDRPAGGRISRALRGRFPGAGRHAVLRYGDRPRGRIASRSPQPHVRLSARSRSAARAGTRAGRESSTTRSCSTRTGRCSRCVGPTKWCATKCST